MISQVSRGKIQWGLHSPDWPVSSCRAKTIGSVRNLASAVPPCGTNILLSCRPVTCRAVFVGLDGDLFSPLPPCSTNILLPANLPLAVQYS
jgi:hypothetical protein